MNWHALRSLIKSPVFAVVAVVSLALGIGANTAVFTLLDQVLLRSLPVNDAQQIVQLKEDGAFYGSNTGMNALSYPLYKDIRDQNQVFSGVICTHSISLSVAVEGRNERAAGEIVSGNYFDVLGVRAAKGRTFHSTDDHARNGAPYVVLSDDYWRTRFAADPGIVGKQMLVNSHRFTIVGVLEPGYRGVDPVFPVQVFLPVMMATDVTQEEKPFDDHFRRFLQVFARLKPDVSMERASASLAPLFHRIIVDESNQPHIAKASAYDREHFLQLKLKVMPGGSGQSEARMVLEGPLWAMMAMVGLVLLIACANVANLMIARAAARQKEIAVRLAIGASRWQIVRQLLLESGIIALAGGVLGLVLAMFCLQMLSSIMPQTSPPMRMDIVPDFRVLLFTFALCVLTALIFGLLPALQAAKPDLAPTLKDQGGAVVGGGQAGWRKALVCLQVSLSLLLLIGAGLFVGTLRNLRLSSPGFQVTNLLSFTVNPTLSGYDKDRAKLFYRQLTDSLRALPGIRSAAMCVVAPLSFDEWDSTISIAGYASKPGEDMSPNMNYTSPGFFATLNVPVFEGRDFTDKDSVGASKVAIVNQKFARHYFGKQSCRTALAFAFKGSTLGSVGPAQVLCSLKSV